MMRLSPIGIGKTMGDRGGWGADENFSGGPDEFEMFIRYSSGTWVMVQFSSVQSLCRVQLFSTP